ncbi:MAG: DUF6017 domain-containing protein, partial [Neglectibacter timonensis]
LLITGAHFKNLSTDAKLLYGLLLDRMGLSAKNGWYDEQGRVYIYYTLEEIMEDMNCGKDKGVKLLSELDANRGIGLIERVKQGQGRPARIYVKRFAARAVPPPSPELPTDLKYPPVRSQDFGFSEVSPSSEVLTSEKPKSGVRKIRSPEVGKTEVYFNRNNYPDNSYLYPSIHPSEPQMDGMDREERKAQVQENIGYIAFTGHDRETVDELVELITDVLCSSQATFRIGGTQFKSEIVKQRFSVLQQSHIEYVLECMRNNTTKIRNIRGYLLTVLYNAPTTIEHYYQAAVQHDLYGQQSGP